MAEWNYKRAEDSTKIFESVKPALEHYFGGELLSTENHENPFAELLDFKCGIDAIVKTDTNTVFGIAHRVKYNYYTDFTIHTKHSDGCLTEIDKMRKDGIKPRYHVQTVCVDGKPIMVAIARSMDLLYAIDILDIATTKTSSTKEQFAILDWNDLINNGINVDIIKL